MKNKSDNELIITIKNSGCNDSFEELLSRHTNLYYKICQKYLPILKQVGVPQGDIFSDLEYVFFKCLNSFDPSRKTKFSTWLGNYTRYNCLNYINSYKRHSFYETTSIDSADDMEYKAEHAEDTSGVDYIYSILSQLKDKRIVEVYKLRYEENGEKRATWSEIATKMSISTQTAINLHSRGKEMLGKKLRSKEHYDLI